MKRATLGFRMHSGWGVLVAVCAERDRIAVADRRRVVVMDEAVRGSKQPYHFAENLKPAAAEQHVAKCSALSERLAREAVREAVRALEVQGYRVCGASVLQAAGRELPGFEKILASHALIHTAEGEFFREAARKACEDSGIPVTRIRERDLGERANTILKDGRAAVELSIAQMGKILGPPWTQDHKAAALAAWIVLSEG